MKLIERLKVLGSIAAIILATALCSYLGSLAVIRLMDLSQLEGKYEAQKNQIEHWKDAYEQCNKEKRAAILGVN
jgi:hypothetical protein